MAPKTSTFFDLKTCLGKSYRHSRPPPHTMCPTAFLAPTLTAKTCFICTQPQNAFFLAQLALQGNRANGAKSRYLVEFPAQKKEPKWFQILGRFKKNSSCSVAKKSPKNWTGPCLSLNMVRRKMGSSSGKRHREMPNLRLKVRTQRRPAQCSSGDRLPERRSYHKNLGCTKEKRPMQGPQCALTRAQEICFIMGPL